MILLDTCSVVCLTGNPRLLSRAASEAIAKARREMSGVAISGHSLWEIAMLSRRNRITLQASLPAFLQYVENMFSVLPITGPIAEKAVSFSEKFPRDPTDRLIAATAVVHGLQLVTKDEKIRKSGEVSCIW